VIKDLKPRTIEKVMCRSNWLKWKFAIEEEYASLCKKKAFGTIINNFTSQHLRYKLVFIHKHNEKYLIIYYKVPPIAQCFTQHLSIITKEKGILSIVLVV